MWCALRGHRSVATVYVARSFVQCESLNLRHHSFRRTAAHLFFLKAATCPEQRPPMGKPLSTQSTSRLLSRTDLQSGSAVYRRCCRRPPCGQLPQFVITSMMSCTSTKPSGFTSPSGSSVFQSTTTVIKSDTSTALLVIRSAGAVPAVRTARYRSRSCQLFARKTLPRSVLMSPAY